MSKLSDHELQEIRYNAIDPVKFASLAGYRRALDDAIAFCEARGRSCHNRGSHVKAVAALDLACSLRKLRDRS